MECAIPLLQAIGYGFGISFWTKPHEMRGQDVDVDIVSFAVEDQDLLDLGHL